MLRLRADVNSPTRRKKERPKELPFEFSIAGGPRQMKTVPIGDHPYFAANPVSVFPRTPGGGPATAPFKEYKAHVFYWIPPNIKKTLELEDGVLAEIPFPSSVSITSGSRVRLQRSHIARRSRPVRTR